MLPSTWAVSPARRAWLSSRSCRQARAVTAKKETVNPAGLAVNYAVADWNNRLVDFGPEEPMLAKALSLITGRTYTPAPGRSAAGIAPIAGVSLPEDARRPAGMLVLSPQHGE